MSTTTAPAVTATKHPYWCDLGKCHATTDQEHHGRETAFYDQRGNVRVEVALAHSEDVVEAVDHGRTHVALTLTATEWFDSASSELTPGEARQLARTLEEYARLAEGSSHYDWIDPTSDAVGQ